MLERRRLRVDSVLMLVVGAAGVVGFADGAGAAVAGDEELGCGAGLLQFLLETGEGVAEGLGFGGLVFELLREAGGLLLMA